jgi:hypothetical protein
MERSEMYFRAIELSSTVIISTVAEILTKLQNALIIQILLFIVALIIGAAAAFIGIEIAV